MPWSESHECEQLRRKAVLAGDEQAWQTWYAESFDDLYRYILWRTAGRRDWADELVQETWLVAVRRVRQFDPQKGLWLDWLRGIAANVIRNHLRRLGQEGRIRPLDAELPPAASTGPEPDPSDRSERIASALAALPEHYETVLRAKYLNDRSVADIALASGQTPKAVESLLTRARKLFRQKYEKIHSNGEVEE
jgi:RNA polymerase sigma-70 factor (ECF subfamily)